MIEPMVIRFQAMAVDNEAPIASLLRIAKAIAVKLQLPEVTAWLDKELNGYPAGSELPGYRITQGALMGHNPINGLIPMQVSNKELEERLRTVHIYNAIGELANSDPEATMIFRYSTEYSHKLQQNQPEFLRFPIVRVIGQHRMINVVDQVRNRLLDWSLALEQEGILGENLQFSQQDKDRAPMTTNNFNFNGNINNNGVIGSDNHDFTQKNMQQITAGDFEALKAILESLGFATEDVQELKNVLASTPEPALGHVLPNVYAWLGKASGRILDAGLDKVAPLAINAISKYLGA